MNDSSIAQTVPVLAEAEANFYAALERSDMAA